MENREIFKLSDNTDSNLLFDDQFKGLIINEGNSIQPSAMIMSNGINPLEKEDEEELLNLATNENAALLAFIAPYVPEKITPSKMIFPSIRMEDEIRVRRAIKEIKKRSPNVNKLFLLINTWGGSVDSSHTIARSIRESFKEIIVFIPHVAASGGTLLALTGNKILMDGILSKISPLDPQTNYLGEDTSVNTIIRSFQFYLSMFETLHEEDAPYILKIMAQKHDPIRLQESFDAADLMTIYTKEILSHKNGDYIEIVNDEPTEESMELVENIVKDFLSLKYPLHEYAIFVNEAKEIRVKAYDILNEDDIQQLNKSFNQNIDEIWDILIKWFEKYHDESSSCHIIRYLSPISTDEDETHD